MFPKFTSCEVKIIFSPYAPQIPNILRKKLVLKQYGTSVSHQ